MHTEAVSVVTKALRILHKQQLNVSDLKSVRDCILEENGDDATTILIEEYGLSREDAQAVTTYLNPAMKGKPVRFDEISVAEIEFPDFEGSAVVDTEDPLSPSVRYYARRGLVIGALVTTSSIGSDGIQIDNVFFDNEFIPPSKLDQV